MGAIDVRGWTDAGFAGGICVRYARDSCRQRLTARCATHPRGVVRSSCSVVVLVLHLSRSLVSVLTLCSLPSTGCVEMREFLVLYLLTLPFQLVTTGLFLEQWKLQACLGHSVVRD